ncbi:MULTISPECIES: DotI/IcmL/TraM family protein [Cysteiniphilum]|uniref:Uncharacterized protein n=1 Tax=Cysteiniphilum litorale TaxID=2056700 RepID=A0A8J2Z363_9GAMM|nr:MULTISPECIES: DotI/IcmL/TraM family protein [Cysteiniphilum]GGF92565.1 hypothetical protein GCM10010995_07130 [Cysteiniphilum litorale]
MLDKFKKKLAGKTSKTAKIEKKRPLDQSPVNSLEVWADKNYFQFFNLLSYVFVVAVTALVLISLYISSQRPDIAFFTVSGEGKVAIKPVGNDSSALSNASVEQFVIEAIPESMDFDFANYHYMLDQNLPRYFTSDAKDELSKYINENIVPGLKENSSFISVKIISSFITDRSLNKAHSVWRVQVPAIINIFNGRVSTSKRVKFQLVINDTGTTLNSYGMQIFHIQVNANWQE